MPTITIDLPCNAALPIVNGPPEKHIIFSVFGDINGNTMRLHPSFTVVDEDGVEHEVRTCISLSGQDIANTHRRVRGKEIGQPCYYLTGTATFPHDFLHRIMDFVAIYSVSTRTGLWLPIHQGANIFTLPNLYVFNGLDQMGKATDLPPKETLKNAGGKEVQLKLKGGERTVEGVVDEAEKLM